VFLRVLLVGFGLFRPGAVRAPNNKFIYIRNSLSFNLSPINLLIKGNLTLATLILLIYSPSI
jgi:hypothetical protein